jgi:hypothetical protein
LQHPGLFFSLVLLLLLGVECSIPVAAAAAHSYSHAVVLPLDVSTERTQVEQSLASFVIHRYCYWGAEMLASLLDSYDWGALLSFGVGGDVGSGVV